MRSPLFDKFIKELLAKEGGFVDRADDSGGPTKYGITQDVARSFGYKGNMKYLAESLAVEIYGFKYWDSLKLSDIEKISPAITEELADTGVNQGVQRAAEFLQRLLNVLNNKGEFYPDIKVDGSIGPATLFSLKAFLAKRKVDGEKVILKGLNCLQGEFYISLAERRPKDEAFIYGWLLNRV